MGRARTEAGFVSHVVVDIQISLVALAVAVAALLPPAFGQLGPVAMEPKLASELLEVKPDGGVHVPAGWTFARNRDGTTGLARSEPAALRWVAPVLLVAAVVMMFVCPLQLPYWLLLAALCGAWGYAVHAGPVEQSVRIRTDHTITLRGSARLNGVLGRSVTVPAKDVETVLVHDRRAEAYFVYRVGREKYGWRIYADTPADARALAALIGSSLARR
jgi:hypothetical protein